MQGSKTKWQGRRDLNPQPPVLETGALPIEPLPFVPTSDSRSESGGGTRQGYQRCPNVPQGGTRGPAYRFGSPLRDEPRSAGLLMVHVASTPTAKFLKFDALAAVHLGLRGDVIPALALLALQGDLHSFIGRHLGLIPSVIRRSGHLSSSAADPNRCL